MPSAYTEPWSVCSHRPTAPGRPAGVGGHEGNQKWGGGRNMPGGSNSVTFFCWWKRMEALFLHYKHSRFPFSSTSLWEQIALNAFLWKLRLRDHSEVWFPLLCHPLYFPRGSVPPPPHPSQKGDSFPMSPGCERLGCRSRYRPCGCSLKKIFSEHFEEDLALAIVRFTGPSTGVKSLGDNLEVAFFINKSKEVFYH